jgi:hypothetical protein
MTAFRSTQHALILFALCVLVGCRSDRNTQVASRQPTRSSAALAAGAPSGPYTIVDRSAYGGQHFGGLRVFNVGEYRFETIDEFIPWVTSLPEGSKLHWNSGCAFYRRVPLRGSKMTMDEFKAFCANRRIEFTWQYGY